MSKTCFDCRYFSKRDTVMHTEEKLKEYPWFCILKHISKNTAGRVCILKSVILINEISIRSIRRVAAKKKIKMMQTRNQLKKIKKPLQICRGFYTVNYFSFI